MTDCESSYQSSSGMSLNHSSISTPFRPCLRPANSKPSASEERSHIHDPKTDIDFITTHFSSPPSLTNITTRIKEDISIQQFLLDLEKGLNNENQMYNTLAGLFNKVAAIVSDGEPIIFHPSYAKRPLGESRQEDRSLAPDFSILPPGQKFTHIDKCNNLRIPWSILESFVEVKTKKRSDHPQGIDYIETLLQYRPDKNFALGMSCNEQTYQFYYADACTQKSSPTFSWKDGLGELVHFIHTLHHNHKEDVGRDTSYTLHDVKWSQDINASARWRVSCHERTNEVQRIFARKGTGRRTWLGIGYEINDSSTGTSNVEINKIRIMKDMWRDKSRRFKESEILDQIHKDGYIAGVVRHISAGPVDGLTVENPQGKVRIKERVNMASTGLRLSACESVLDFLKVMYDLVETHEQLLEKRDVLHRDISWYNVLCKPEHFTGDAKVIEHATIGKILRKEGKEREPLCLLTDFDNASIMKETHPSGAAERTGTPMFMACELSYGLRIRTWLKDVPAVTLEQLSLEGNILEAYLDVYTDERYNKYQDWLQSVLSLPVEKYDPFTLSHRPHHDMESVYWIIVWFIIKALPTPTEDGLVSGSGRHDLLKTDMFSRGIDIHKNTYLLAFDEGKWKDSLDPVYEPLVAMLVTMSRYLCMRWSELPEVLPWHAHEAFKRLLLKEIIRMSNVDFPIPIQGPRPPPRKSVSAKRSTTKATTQASPIPQPGPSSSHGFHAPESQSVGSQKRQNSTPPDSEPLPKKPRCMETTGTVEDNPNPLARIVENLASDVWWFV